MELEDIQLRHKQERKELQAQTQKIKHSVPKGDKKRLKEAKEEIARLEAELDAKQEKELQEEELSRATAAVSIEPSTELCNAEVEVEEPVHQKKSKAAKRREKKEKEEKERRARLEEGAKESLTGARHVEQMLLAQKLSHKSLKLYDIASDGDCLYNAVLHQLRTQSENEHNLTVPELRAKLADEMRRNKQEYMPFLTSRDGDMLDEEGFHQYCHRLETTHEWGGHVEIKAMTAVLKCSVLIIQADLPDIVIEHENRDGTYKALTIIYHKRLYELGEHYNSVIPIS